MCNRIHLDNLIAVWQGFCRMFYPPTTLLGLSSPDLTVSHSFTCRILPLVIFSPVFLCTLLYYPEDVSIIYFSEMSVNLYQSVWCYISEGGIFLHFIWSRKITHHNFSNKSCVRDEGTIGCVFIDRSTGRMERSVVRYQVWKKFVRRFELHWRAFVMITSATSIQHHIRYFKKKRIACK